MKNANPLIDVATVLLLALPVLASLGGAIAASGWQAIQYLKLGHWEDYTTGAWLRFFQIDATTGWVGLDRLVETTHVSATLFTFMIIYVLTIGAFSSLME